MRTIIFRGYSKVQKEYLYGSCVKYSKSAMVNGTTKFEFKTLIISSAEQLQNKSVERKFEVIPETLGQFAGTQDEQSDDVYENDIVESIAINDKDPNPIVTGVVTFEDCQWRIISEETSIPLFSEARVINIIDNSNLGENDDEK